MKNNTDSILLVEQLSLCDIMVKNCKEKVQTLNKEYKFYCNKYLDLNVL